MKVHTKTANKYAATTRIVSLITHNTISSLISIHQPSIIHHTSSVHSNKTVKIEFVCRGKQIRDMGITSEYDDTYVHVVVTQQKATSARIICSIFVKGQRVTAAPLAREAKLSSKAQ